VGIPCTDVSHDTLYCCADGPVPADPTDRAPDESADATGANHPV